MTIDPVKQCVTCHVTKGVSEFNRARREMDGHQPRCRECFMSWYANNRVPHGDSVRDRKVRVRGEHQARLAAFLLKNPCSDCGEADLAVLEFDHRPGEDRKRANIAVLIAEALSWPVIALEISKCDVRCANCHRRRTSERAGFWREAYFRPPALRRLRKVLECADDESSLEGAYVNGFSGPSRG
jgi:hypothetical protein